MLGVQTVTLDDIKINSGTYGNDFRLIDFPEKNTIPTLIIQNIIFGSSATLLESYLFNLAGTTSLTLSSVTISGTLGMSTTSSNNYNNGRFFYISSIT